MYNYNQFLFENITFLEFDILESLVTSTENLLQSIEAKEVNLFDTFKLNRDEFDVDFDIEHLFNNKGFNAYLDKNGLKKSDIESTDDSETFLEKTYDVKFFSIHKLNQSELEKPQYIILQSKPKEQKKWNPVRCYEVNGDMRKFYDEMTSKTIEITKNDKNWVYSTSNSGTEWVLKNIEDGDDTFKETLTTQDIRDILKDKSIKLNIIK